MKDQILTEAKRLYDLGFAIHWLHPNSKRPIESGWTTGPRKDWDYLKTTYIKGLNVGVRLGTPSKISGGFLGVLDVDLKSSDARHAKEVQENIQQLAKIDSLPEVTSGRGNGSRHYYILTEKPLTPFLARQSPELIKVPMPSSGKPSKRDIELLTPDELHKGIRIRPAWEIGVMGDGQQVVLPPSIHPDSKKPYAWKKDFIPSNAKIKETSKLTAAPKKLSDTNAPLEKDKVKVDGFEVESVDLSWLPISDKIKKMIITGEGVTDRSAMLLPVCHALVSAGLSRNEILSVLTDTDNFLGGVGYDHAKTSSRLRAANWIYKFTLKKVMEEKSAEFMFREPIAEAKELTKEEIEADAKADLEVRHWTENLELTKDDKYRTTLTNTVLILENAIGGAPWVKRDLFAFRDFYSQNTPWGGKKGAAIVDDDLSQIRLWLGRRYGMEPSSSVIGEALTILAVENSFDPAVDWLNGLPEWDEVPRLDTWLKKNFGAKGSDEYLAQVFRKWIFGMVLRIFEPGAEFSWMPIFEGAQGVGKSSFGRILVGDKFFLDWLPDLNNKDSALALQGVWAVEMGELASFRKNEIETVKAFITRKVDKVRPPYGERWLESPRRCVFFGTTNYETYLRDDSGNRRFKPLKVGKLNFDVLIEEREQLFAEALWLYRTGFESQYTIELTGDARIYEKEIQAEKMVADESVLMQESFLIFMEKEMQKDPEERFDFSKFRMQDLFDKNSAMFQGGSPFQNWKFDSRHAQFGAKALKMIGFEKFKSSGSVYWRSIK